jgi:hypothetical protein
MIGGLFSLDLKAKRKSDPKEHQYHISITLLKHMGSKRYP